MDSWTSAAFPGERRLFGDPRCSSEQPISWDLSGPVVVTKVISLTVESCNGTTARRRKMKGSTVMDRKVCHSPYWSAKSQCSPMEAGSKLAALAVHLQSISAGRVDACGDGSKLWSVNTMQLDLPGRSRKVSWLCPTTAII